ncbi:MAG: cytochrome c, class [Ramlibacter sp.]|nr:cytochrome c, class [Ramlibacter sp.]
MPAGAGVEEGRQKAQACVACHGPDGNSQAPAFPSIAGQPRQFIEMSLIMFREGRRINEVMKPIVDKMSNADVRDLAQYFAGQTMAPPARKPDAEVAARGREITEKNNCVQCHGPRLTGQQHIPRLAGQHKEYLLAQLKGFKAAKRADFDGTMTSAAQALSADQLDLVADYLSTLSPP